MTMEEAQARIDRALEAVYAEFAKYRPVGPILVSPYEPPECLRPLEAKPLRSLTAEDLGAYSGGAVWLMGTSSDFKYFFPRMAELALHEVVGGSSWDSWLTRLAPALADERERSVVQELLRAVWATVPETYWDAVRVDSVAVLYAMTEVVEDLGEVLGVFSPCRTEAAARHLRDVAWRGRSYASLARGLHHPELARWLDDEMPAAVNAGAQTYPHVFGV